MNRKTLLAIMLILLLINMLASAFNIQPAKAITIVVPDDYPTIQEAINAANTGDTIYVRSGTYYEQVNTQNCAPGLRLIGENRDTTIIDAGGSPYYAIELSTDNNTISGFTLRNPGYPYGGIRFYHASNNLLNDTTIAGVHYGIEMTRANNNTIQYCNVSESIWYGIVIDFDSSNNTVKENTISHNGLVGMQISAHSSYPPGPINNAIYHNNFVANTEQVSIYDAGLDFANIWDNGYPSGGNYWSDYTDTDLYCGPGQNEPGNDGIWDNPYVIDGNNQDNYPLANQWIPFQNQIIYIRADGRIDPSGAPIQRSGYQYGLTADIKSSSDGIIVQRSNIVIDGEGHTLQGSDIDRGITVSNNNVTIKNTSIMNFSTGVYLNTSSYNKIIGNYIANNTVGIYALTSNYNTISLNNIRNHTFFGVAMVSNYSIVSQNSITNNSHGIGFGTVSNHNTISGNNVTNNNGVGIYLYGASNNNVSENIVTNNSRGIWLVGSPPDFPTSYNTISRNNVTNNREHGIYLEDCSSNQIYHNNFINNAVQVFTVNSVNVWDNGYPSCGNYWSNYANVDVKCGPNQDQAGNDRIWDNPYSIDGSNKDGYPLVNAIATVYSFSIMTSTGGYTSPAPQTYVCPANIIVVIAAIPRPDWWFLKWDASFPAGASNPLKVTIDSNDWLKAIFDTSYKYPRCDELIIKTIKSPATAVTMGQQGTLDQVVDITSPARLQTLINSGLTIDQTSGFQLCSIAINQRDVKPDSSGVYYAYRYWPGVSNYPLNVTAVRQAINYLTDKSIIYTVLGAIVTEAFSVIPPANSKWYDSSVSYWPYDPFTAYALLTGSGAAWVFDNGIYVPDPSKWNPGDAGWPGAHYPVDYIPLRALWFMYPSAAIAPTSYQVCNGICETWNNWLNTWAGTTEVDYIGKDEVEYDQLIYVGYYNRDFDLCFLCLDLSPDIDYMYYCFHSDNDIVGGDNLGGLRDAYIDSELYKVMFWKSPGLDDFPLSEAQLWTASSNVQHALFDYTNPNALCPWIPIYHRKYTAAYRENLADGPESTFTPANVTNWVQSPGFSSYAYQASCQWAYTMIHDNDGASYGGTIQLHDAGVPQSLNPVLAVWTYEAKIINRYYDSGYQWHPTYHVELPWYIVGWKYEKWNVPGVVEAGMKVTYYLRDDVYWQDGTKATAADAKWNYDYIASMQFENWYATWMYYMGSSAPTSNKLVVYLNTTGLWYIHVYATNCFVFPRAMWEDKTTSAEAEAYTPWLEVHPDWAGDPGTWPAWWPYDWPLTQAYGVGPFVLKTYDAEGLFADMFPNPIFWVNNTRVVGSVMGDATVLPGGDLVYNVIVQNVDKYESASVTAYIYEDDVLVHVVAVGVLGAFDFTTLGEYTFGGLAYGAHTIKVVVTDGGQTHQYIHHIMATVKEDINKDGFVNAKDAVALGSAFSTKPGDLGGVDIYPSKTWNPAADINNDGFVNAKDAVLLGAKFNYPY